ncbi:hypothetical protein GH714_031008 [Hevea brasiliensis]|uniref:Uncharacterized protein n=1 Tax=Hevea brasiliensis TaxID=3981 RepID=A0A6A6N8J6_HEVBR|nr:hypothetical protein GH714_031008 [Hevea brasiliensis]
MNSLQKSTLEARSSLLRKVDPHMQKKSQLGYASILLLTDSSSASPRTIAVDVKKTQFNVLKVGECVSNGDFLRSYCPSHSSKKHSAVKDSSSNKEDDTRQASMSSEIGLSNAYKVNEGLEKSCALAHSLDQQAAFDDLTHLGDHQLHVSPIGGDNCDDNSCSYQP